MANDQMFNPMNPMQAALLGPDILQKQFQMEQNRRYADLLQAQSMEPMQGQMVDGHYIAPSPVQGLANMLRSYVSRKTMDDLPKQMSELANAQNSQIDNMFGVGGGNVPQTDASRMALAGGAQTGSFGPTVDNANRMNNVQNGTGSAYPIPAGMDGRLAATLYKIDPRKYAEALATHSTPTDLMKNSNWLGRSQAEVLNGVRSKERADSAVTGGNTYWNSDGSMGIAPDMKTGAAGGFDANGNVIAKPIIGWGENNARIKGLEAGSVSGAQAANKPMVVNLPNGPVLTTEGNVVNQVNGTNSAQPGVAENQGSLQRNADGSIPLESDTSKEFGKSVADKSAGSLLDGRDKAKTAADDLYGIQQARLAIQGGAYQSTGANWKLEFTKFANANLGISINADKAANTDYLKSTLGKGLLEQAKTLGSNPSNADAQRINDIVGSIGKDPEAMNKILDWRQEMASRVINNHNATVEDAEKRGLKSPYDLRIKHPEIGNKKPANNSASVAPDRSALEAEARRRGLIK